MKKLSQNDIIELIVTAGKLGFGIEDLRILLPIPDEYPDEVIDQILNFGKTLHRVTVAGKLYGIIESNNTNVKDLVIANKHLSEINSNTAMSQSGNHELIQLLRQSVPAQGDYEDEYADTEEEGGSP